MLTAIPEVDLGIECVSLNHFSLVLVLITTTSTWSRNIEETESPSSHYRVVVHVTLNSLSHLPLLTVNISPLSGALSLRSSQTQISLAMEDMRHSVCLPPAVEEEDGARSRGWRRMEQFKQRVGKSSPVQVRSSRPIPCSASASSLVKHP